MLYDYAQQAIASYSYEFDTIWIATAMLANILSSPLQCGPILLCQFHVTEYSCGHHGHARKYQFPRHIVVESLDTIFYVLVWMGQ